jgi:hypothetical protein
MTTMPVMVATIFDADAVFEESDCKGNTQRRPMDNHEHLQSPPKSSKVPRMSANACE